MEPGDNSPIPVVFCVCDPTGEYCKYVATTIVSLLRHTSHKVSIHILCDESVSDENKSLLSQTTANLGSSVTYHNVSVPEWVNKLDSLKNITVGTLFRLFIPKILDTFDKVVYLDGDILVQCDVADLFNQDLDGLYAGVILDTPETRQNFIRSRFYRKLHVVANQYFNAGVMVFNCKEINNHMNLLEEGLKILGRIPCLTFADQDVLNILFQGKIRVLDSKFNRQVDLLYMKNTEITDSLNSDAILHFSGYIKPWNCSNSYAANHYFQYMQYTPYADTPEKMCKVLSALSENYKQRMTLKKGIWYFLRVKYPIITGYIRKTYRKYRFDILLVNKLK